MLLKNSIWNLPYPCTFWKYILISSLSPVSHDSILYSYFIHTNLYFIHPNGYVLIVYIILIQTFSPPQYKCIKVNVFVHMQSKKAVGFGCSIEISRFAICSSAFCVSKVLLQHNPLHNFFKCYLTKHQSCIYPLGSTLSTCNNCLVNRLFLRPCFNLLLLSLLEACYFCYPNSGPLSPLACAAPNLQKVLWCNMRHFGTDS